MAYSHADYKAKFLKKMKARFKNLKDRGDNFNAQKCQRKIDRMND